MKIMRKKDWFVFALCVVFVIFWTAIVIVAIQQGQWFLAGFLGGTVIISFAALSMPVYYAIRFKNNQGALDEYLDSKRKDKE